MENSGITLILAPLQGYTDVTFRNVFSRHFSGVTEALAPFISTMGQMRLKPSRIKDVAPEKNTGLPVIPQILGNVPEDFIFLANHLHKMGHTKLNWNLGCPHSKIARKKRGSGLLMYPEEIQSFLSKVIPAVSATLSVKVRLGRHSKTELFTLLPILDAYPLDEIIIHPRTGIQMYTGACDHETFAKAMDISRHTLTYNGDITDLDAFCSVKKKFRGITRFMIGRGLLANPFLAEEIKQIRNPRSRAQRLIEFHDALFDAYRSIFSGPGHLTGRMKGFWKYLGPSFYGSQKFLKKILKAGSLENYLAAVELFFDKGLEFKP